MANAASDSLFRQADQLLAQNPPDYGQALPLLQQAARQGHAEAAFQLAGIFLEQSEPDIEAAIPWLEIAAKQNHPYAVYNLLHLRERAGEPFSAFLSEYAWLGERGILAAQLRLLEYYADHHEPQAVYWARKAAGQGHPFGQYFLAQHYHLSGEADLTIARGLYHEAAEQGLSVAHWQLGKIYRKGMGTQPDLERAAFHLRQAAEQGFIGAQTMLADVLAEQGNPDALDWYKAAADQRDYDAVTALARHYLIGTLTERNQLKAVRYAETAAEYGHPEALSLMGDIYRYGLGVRPDHHTAQNYYRQAAEAGSLSACHKLLSDAALHDQDHYEDIKRTALILQHIEKTFQEALAYQEGIGRQQDYTAARKLYLEAAEFHHSGAAAQLGVIYYYGQGVKYSPKEAAYWFETAAVQDNAMAQYHLARMYYYGRGVPFNVATACRWLQAAIWNGYENPAAFKHLLAQWRRRM